MRNLSHLQLNRGFTLVELVIAIVLIGILSAVGSSMIADSFTTTRMVDASQTGASQARYAMERIAREIRETQYNSSNGKYAISTMTANQYAFTKIVNPSDTNGTTVTIKNTGTDLTLGYSSPATSSLLTNQVDSFSLDYYDISGASTKSDSAIRFVQISLTVKDPTSGQSIAQRTRVALRNGI